MIIFSTSIQHGKFQLEQLGKKENGKRDRVKLSLFIEGILLLIENPKEHTQTTRHHKLCSYKLQDQYISPFYFYTLAVNFLKRKLIKYFYLQYYSKELILRNKFNQRGQA